MKTDNKASLVIYLSKTQLTPQHRLIVPTEIKGERIIPIKFNPESSEFAQEMFDVSVRYIRTEIKATDELKAFNQAEPLVGETVVGAISI